MITTKTDVMLVRTRRPLWAPLTGVIIPKGQLGKVLSYENSILTVDFQLSTVHRIAADSPLVEIVRV